VSRSVSPVNILESVSNLACFVRPHNRRGAKNDRFGDARKLNAFTCVHYCGGPVERWRYLVRCFLGIYSAPQWQNTEEVAMTSCSAESYMCCLWYEGR